MREVAAGDAAGKAQVVFDARRRPGLAAGCLALDHHRPQALGSAIHGGRKTRRPAADDHDVVGTRGWSCLQSQSLGEIPLARLHEEASFGRDDRKYAGSK